MRVTLIITTYNWPEALSLTLKSVLRQTRLPDEVIVADDGSKEETAQTVRNILGGAEVPWAHVRQEDLSVRQSRIKNLAVKYCRGDYLIFIDHDVVLHPDFIFDHLAMALDGCFLQGKRVILPQVYTEMLLATKFFKPPSLFLPDLGNRKNTLRLPRIGRMFSRVKEFETSLRGCNLSLFKKDYLEVDGFDEAYDQSWGREDSDICYRLFHAGIRIRTLWFMALQYHLYHKTFSHWDQKRLDGELSIVLKENRVRARMGISQLTSEGEVIATSDNYRR